MNLPNFLCIGTQKSGTTTLHNILRQHPDIFLPDNKEAHFFDIEECYNMDVEWWFRKFFSNYSAEKIIGAFTPEYLFYEEVPSRIKKHLGENLKILILLRNPVERAYSHYLMSVNRVYESLNFIDAIKHESERIKKNEFGRNHFSYISRGLYSDQILRYLNIFNSTNIFYCIFEDDIIVNMEKTIPKILNFLGVKQMDLDINIKSNMASHPRSKLLNNQLFKYRFLKNILKPFIPNPEKRKKIINIVNSYNQKSINRPKLNDNVKQLLMQKYFFNDIIKLEKIINRDLSGWHKFNE